MTTHSLPQTATQTQVPTAAWTVAPDVRIADYQPASPAEVDPATSLADLRQIKANWLAQAESFGDFTTLATVARELAHPVDRLSIRIVAGDFPGCTVIPGLSRNLNATNDRYLAVEDLQIYYEETTGIDPYTRKYIPVANVHVLRGGHYLARFSQTIPAPHTTAAALLIPGPWLQPLRALLPQAEAHATARYQAALEADRQALLNELGIPAKTAPQITNNHQPSINNHSPSPASVIIQPLAAPNQPLITQPANPFVVEGHPITRLDFFLNEDGTCIIQKLAETPASNGRPAVLSSETKTVDLAKTAAYLHQHGYCTRRWDAVQTPTYKKPAGMRAWKGDEPTPIRTEGQIRKLRAQLNGHAAGLAHALNLAFDL